MLLTPVAYIFVAWLLSLLVTGITMVLLRRARVLDTPNARSSHKKPVPRGAGVGFIGVILLLGITSGFLPIQVAIGAAFLSIFSFIDDAIGLTIWVRLPAQLLAIVLTFPVFPPVLHVVPVVFAFPLIGYFALIFAWLWYVNLTNFMDGIDGISALETIAIMVGICVLRIAEPTISQHLAFLAGIIAASMVGFYSFNREPAKIFMGDAGSIPLGFLTGYMLLALCMQGYVAAAIILPSYYVSDATFTLLRRAYRLEKIWLPHSQHAYQKAVLAGWSHSKVVRWISALNAVLIVLALISLQSMMAAGVTIICAYAASAVIMYRFSHASHSH